MVGQSLQSLSFSSFCVEFGLARVNFGFQCSIENNHTILYIDLKDINQETLHTLNALISPFSRALLQILITWSPCYRMQCRYFHVSMYAKCRHCLAKNST